MSMTRAEAIEILERKTTIPGDGYTFEQINEALDLAIETLRTDLARVAAERDGAVSDLELFATCDTCKFGEMKMAYDCLGCDHASNWKWRGIKED